MLAIHARPYRGLTLLALPLVLAWAGACQSTTAQPPAPATPTQTAAANPVATTPGIVAIPATPSVAPASPSASPAAAASPAVRPAAAASPSVSVSRAVTAPGVASGADAGNLLTAVRTVVQQVKPAVVQITNQQQVQTGQFNQPFVVPAGVGSGVIYDNQGHILTNNHVIEGAQQLLVSSAGQALVPCEAGRC